MGVFVCPFTWRMCVCENFYVCACACMCRDMISVLCIDKLSAFSRVSLRLDKLPVLSANALRQDRAVSFAIQFFLIILSFVYVLMFDVVKWLLLMFVLMLLLLLFVMPIIMFIVTVSGVNDTIVIIRFIIIIVSLLSLLQ